MKLFDFLRINMPDLRPEDTKIHLAVYNGRDDPLDVYFSGQFKEWQEEQTQRNFERPFILSLIKMQGQGRWLFAGTYRSLGYENKGAKDFLYQTEAVLALEEFIGRLVVEFQRSGRQSYRDAETLYNGLTVGELYARKLSIGEFKGFKNTKLTKSQLDIIVKQNIESWRAALSGVSGVYLIADTHTGKLYVGSACGEGGIWSRWCEYSFCGHGNNVALKELIDKNGYEYAMNFQFSVLEIADTHASGLDIIAREKFWKETLCTQKHGYNRN